MIDERDQKISEFYLFYYIKIGY